jgi:hypothetical protein
MSLPPIRHCSAAAGSASQVSLHDIDVMTLVVQREKQHLPNGQLSDQWVWQLKVIELPVGPAGDVPSQRRVGAAEIAHDRCAPAL